MKTVMVVLGGGGHTKQLMPLIERLSKRYKIEYVIRKDGKPARKSIKGRIFKIMNPRTMQDKNPFLVTFKLFPYTIEAFWILSKSNSNAIIICGPAVSVPIAFLGKLLFRKKLIFIESWSRIKSGSLSGKLVAWLSDLIFVQWPGNKSYKKAIYAGRFG